MELAQHLIAILAAVLLGGASVLQAHHSLLKAEHERIRMDGSGPRFWPSVWARPVPGESSFDLQHFRRVAASWWVIAGGSALALVAEVIDLALAFG